MGKSLRIIDKRQDDLDDSRRKTKKIEKELAQLQADVNFLKIQKEIKEQFKNNVYDLDKVFSVDNARQYLRNYKNSSEKHHRTTYIAALQICLRFCQYNGGKRRCYEGPINGKRTKEFKEAIKIFEREYKVKCGNIMSEETRGAILKVLDQKKAEREAELTNKEGNDKKQTPTPHKTQNNGDNPHNDNTPEVQDTREIQNKKEALEKSLHDIKTTINDYVQKITALQEKINTLQTSSTDPNIQQQLIQKKQEFMNTKSELERKATALQAEQEQLLQQLTSLSQKGQVSKQEIETIQNKITTLTHTVQQFKESTEQFITNITNYEKEIFPENFGYHDVLLNEDFFNSTKNPLFMSGTSHSLSHFFGETQYQEIFDNWNPSLTYSGKNIDSFKNETIRIPLIVDSLKGKVPATLEEYKNQSKYQNHPRLKNAKNDLLVIKKIDDKFVLCFYKNQKLHLATAISPGKSSLGDTPTGVFSLGYTSKYCRSSQFENAPMPYAIHVDRAGQGGIFLHQGYSDGNPQSHGCIRIPGLYQQYLFDKIGSNSHIPIVIEDNDSTSNNQSQTPEKRENNSNYLTMGGKRHKINIHSGEVEPLGKRFNGFFMDCNGYGVPFSSFDYREEKQLTSSESYEYFVLLIKNSYDNLKIRNTWRNSGTRQSWNDYKNDYLTKLIKQGNYQDPRKLIQKAKDNIKNNTTTSLNSQDIAKLKRNIRWQKMDVNSRGIPTYSGIAPYIIQRKNDIFIGSYNSIQRTFCFLGPQKQYFLINQ